MVNLAPMLIFALPVLGVGLLWLVHAVYRRQPATRPAVMQVLLTIIAWLLIAIGLLTPMIASCIGLIVVVIAAVVASMAFVQYRANERRALLWMLAISAERGLPLSQAARAFATDRSDGVGRSAIQLAELLDSGTSLPDALKRAGIRLPIDAEITTRLEHAAGGLGHAMIDASRDAATRHRTWRPLFEKSLYFLLLTIVAAIVMTFLMLKVVPAFQQIFYDFDTELPAMTQLVISAADWFARWFFVFTPLFAIAMLVLTFGALYYIGCLRWEPRIVRVFSRPFHRATILLSLARSVEAGRPLEKTMDLLARWYPEASMRESLEHVSERIRQGSHWCEVMRSAGLVGHGEAALLLAAERVGNLPWAMREMAQRNYRRLEMLAGVTNNLILPLLLLMYALPVGFVVIALFLPVVSLIQNLA